MMQKDSNVRSFLLANNLVVMGEVTEEDDAMFVIKDAIRLLEMPPQEGSNETHLAMVPLLPFTQAMKHSVLLKTGVLIVTEPIPEIVKEYNAKRSGIILPDAPKLQV